jgi:hypothetical protein
MGRERRREVTPEFGGYYRRNFIPQIQDVTARSYECSS